MEVRAHGLPAQLLGRVLERPSAVVAYRPARPGMRSSHANLERAALRRVWVKLPGLRHSARSKSQARSSAVIPSTPKWRVAPSAATTTRRMSPRGLASRQKAVKFASPLSDKNSGGTVAAPSPLLAPILGWAVSRAIMVSGAGIGSAGGTGAIDVAVESFDGATLVLFSVSAPGDTDSGTCINSLGRSRSARLTTSRSTSDSSDSKVICVLLGRDMETLTMFTLKPRVQGYPLIFMGSHRNVSTTQRQTGY